MTNYFWTILMTRDSFEFLTLLALAAVKSTLLLAFVALLSLTFRRFSAATRHLLWTFAICASLLLPCLSFLTVWNMPILPSTQLVVTDSGLNQLTVATASATPEMEFQSVNIRETFVIQANESLSEEMAFSSGSSNLPATSPANETPVLQQLLSGILGVWFIGVMLLLLRLLVGFSTTGLLARRSTEFKNTAHRDLFSSLLMEFNLKSRVRLLRSEGTKMPIVCGVRHPLVLLPASADQWSEERLRMVLLHELTHVERRDCLTQMLAQIACAFYWFNPLVWYAAKRLRVEREQACDDRVLSIGTKPSDYAHHLLEIARSMQNSSVFEWSKATTVAMARKSQLEGRLLAILSRKGEQCGMSRLLTGSVVTLICVLFLSLGLIRPTVADANQLQASKTGSASEIEEPAELTSNTFSVLDSEKRPETKSLNEKTQKTVERLDKNNDVINETLLKQQKNVLQAESSNEISSDTNLSQRSVLQAETRLEQNDNALPQTKASPFVDVRYGTERQNKPADFIDEMASVGFTNLSINELITLKTYRVTADFVRGLRALGFNNLTPKSVVSLRIYNVTPAYIEAMAAAGYKGLTLRELTNSRIYGVSPEYARAIRDAGYPSLSIAQIIEFKIYGITPELVRSARGRLGDLTPRQLISLKNSGVFNQSKDKNKDNK